MEIHNICACRVYVLKAVEWEVEEKGVREHNGRG
jgi:hypothetical protein